MSTIITDGYDEPTPRRVLPFPTDPFAKPAFSWRTWAAGQLATWRERRAKAIPALLSDVQPDRMRSKGEAENAQQGTVSARQRLECWTEPDTSAVAVSTDTQGSPRSSTNWRHLTAIRREWAEQNATVPAEIVVSVDEIRETERAVSDSLYPKAIRTLDGDGGE